MKIFNFMKKPTNFLVYCGSPGIGKTFLCAALTEWIMINFHEDWRYFTENEILKRLRNSMDNEKGDYLDSLKYMLDVEFLIIDDLGSSVKASDWREEILFAMLDQRYNSMKPTIITSNYSALEFYNKYHHRIYSRLFSQENTIIEIPDGVDYRLQVRSDPNYKIEEKKNE